jgi:hypothetical protein
MASKMLEIGAGLTLPLSWMTMASVVYGNRGTGKSTFGRVIAEEIVNHGQRFCALDIAGAFWGLKASASGTDTGLPIVIFGGEHADVPLETGAGTKVAEVVASISQSVILDFELMSKGKQIAFLGEFLERLYHINRDPLLLLMDEAQRYAPQKPMSVEANKTLGATEDIVKLGRKHGLGPVVFTQRGSGLNKEVSELADVLVAFRSPGVLDQKRIKEWLEANATAEQQKEVMAKISSLPTGTAIVASNHPDLPLFGAFAIRRPRTFDSSATPKPGERRVEPKVLAQADIEVLKVEMAEAIERAKAEDPKELRKEVARLKGQIADLIADPMKVEYETIVEKPVPFLTDEARAQIDELTATLQSISEQLDTESVRQPIALDRLHTEPTKAVIHEWKPDLRPARIEDMGRADPEKLRQAGIAVAVAARSPSDGEMKLGKPELAILATLAVNPEGLIQKRLSTLTGYSIKSSGFGIALATLRREELVEKGPLIKITDKGLGYVPDGVELPPPPGPELVDYWLRKLKTTEQRILRVMIDAHPEQLTIDEIAERAGYSPKSSGLGIALGKLRSTKLINGFRVSEDVVGS